MLNSVVPGFQEMSRQHKILTIICPTNTKAAKLVNKYIDILFKARNQIDEGTPVQNIVDRFANYSNANIWWSFFFLFSTIICTFKFLNF